MGHAHLVLLRDGRKAQPPQLAAQLIAEMFVAALPQARTPRAGMVAPAGLTATAAPTTPGTGAARGAARHSEAEANQGRILAVKETEAMLREGGP